MPMADAIYFLARLDQPTLRAPLNGADIMRLKGFIGTVGDWRWGRIADLAAAMTGPDAPEVGADVREWKERANAALGEAARLRERVLRIRALTEQI